MVEGVASQQQQLDEVARDVPTGNVQPASEVRQRKTLVDGADVSDAIATVDDHACEQAWTGGGGRGREYSRGGVDNIIILIYQW